MTIPITVNGEPQTVAADTSLFDLLEQLKVDGRIAVDINGEIIPKSTHSSHLIHANDKIEIVHAIGGG